MLTPGPVAVDAVTPQPQPAPGSLAGAGHRYAHVRIGSCHVAVPADGAVRAMALPQAGLTRLPRRRGGALAGLVAVDGSPVPVVDLDRWVPLGTPADPADARILVLRAGRSLLAIQVDALLGVKRIDAGSIRRVHQTADADELFESVLPAAADRPLLCLLEVDRLRALVDVWCEAAGVRPPEVGAARRQTRQAGVRHAVIEVADEYWAVPVLRIAELARTPAIEMRRRGQRVCGIGLWSGRKVPVVDMASATRRPGAALPEWMAVVGRGSRAIGLLTSRCERFVDLAPDDIAAVRGDELLSGTTLLPGLGKVSVLDADKLFDAVPESRISESPAGARAPVPERLGAAADPSPYLVFETDRRYASPVAGLVAVVELPPGAIRELVAGRVATLAWRGRAINVVNLPPIDGVWHEPDPRLAIILAGATPEAPCSGIAVRRVLDWLPAHVARRSGLRNHSIGELSMITAPQSGPTGSGPRLRPVAAGGVEAAAGAGRPVQPAGASMSLLVIDLPQMAFFLS